MRGCVQVETSDFFLNVPREKRFERALEHVMELRLRPSESRPVAETFFLSFHPPGPTANNVSG